MKRKLLIAALALLVLIAGVSIFLYNSINPIVKTAIERFGSDITGTKVSVGSVDISLKSGRGTIRGVKVDNPEGFSSGDAFELGEITVDLDIASINKDPIVIEEVRIIESGVRAELDEQGRTNLKVIKEHVEAFQTGAAKPESNKRDGGYEKHFVIKKLVFDRGKLEVDATAVGSEEKSLDMPPMNLNDVGGSRGVTPAALGKTITNAYLAQATRAVTDQVKAEVKDRAEDEAKKKLGEILGR